VPGTLASRHCIPPFHLALASAIYRNCAVWHPLQAELVQELVQETVCTVIVFSECVSIVCVVCVLGVCVDSV
jgi:hypothetical protein